MQQVGFVCVPSESVLTCKHVAAVAYVIQDMA